MAIMKTIKFPGDIEPREIYDEKARNSIGNLSELSTTDKTNIVKSVNEVVARIDDDLSDYATKNEIPTKVSDLINDAGYLTAHQSLEGLATESYVNNKIASVVNSAPEALNTLDKLAAALGDDENFAATVTNQIASKQDIITGTSGQFVIIGDDGKPTTKTVPYAEEATF